MRAHVRDAVRALYSAITADDEAWLRALLEATAGFFDRGCGSMGWLFRPESGFVPIAPAAVNGAESLIDAAVKVSAALGGASLARALLAPSPLVTASEAHGVGARLLENAAYREHAHPLGIRDFLALKAVSPFGTGCLIGTALTEIATTSEDERRSWGDVAMEMSNALRVRDIIHGWEVESGRHALPMMGEAVPASQQLSALMRCERVRKMPGRLIQVAHLLIHSDMSYKLIADELGVSVGTVRKHVERLYRVLQVHSRQELVKKFG